MNDFLQTTTRPETDQNTEYGNQLVGISNMEISNPANLWLPFH